MIGFRARLTAAVGAACLAALATTATADLLDETPHLVVAGRGTVEAVPDMATVTLGVELEASTAEEVSRQAADRMRDVFAVLEGAGVAGEDVQTTGLSLRPVYEPHRQDVNRQPRLRGFAAENTIQVIVRDLDGLGELLDAVIREGANSFRGVRFGLQDSTIAEEDARRDAVADALGKATLLAEAAGVARGPILVMREGGVSMPRPEMAAMRMADSPGVPMAPGSLTVSAEVLITFALDQ